MQSYFKKLICYFMILILAVTLSGVTTTSASTKYYEMKVHYIDVGESDSVLIESNKHFMLIDAGNTDDDSRVVSYLSSQKVKKLDYVICTHPHADHVGGMDSVINKFSIGKVIMPNKSNTTQAFEKVLTAIKDKGLKITKPIVGDNYILGKAKFTIIAPNSYSYGDNLNNYSVGIKLVNGKNSFIFIGDNETEAIEDITSNKINLDADVLMCGHHGSVTSTTASLLKAVSPKYAIISVGKNSYGHPSGETIKLLANRNIKTYRTDKSGTIIATSTGTKIAFNAKPTISKVTSSTSKTTKSITNNTNKSTNSSKVVYITKTGKKYHLANCPYLRSSKIKVTLKQAKAKGMTPCSRCNPPE